MSACHSNISKISQIRIFQANPGVTFFSIIVPVPLSSPERWRQRRGLPQREAAGTHTGAQPLQSTPLRGNERNRGRSRAALCGFCRSISAAGRALSQAWAVPARAPGGGPAPAERDQLRRRRWAAAAADRAGHSPASLSSRRSPSSLQDSGLHGIRGEK